MVREIRIYYEGDRRLREGLSAFFSELQALARARRCGFRLISGKSGPEACEDFGRAIRDGKDASNFLLIDSEGPCPEGHALSLCRDYGWDESHADSIFSMVEMQEAWFHADPEKLEEFYGPNFNRNALKANPRVEEIPKADLQRGLKEATKRTAKGNYFDNKVSHGSKLFAAIRPAYVRKAAPHCRDLFAAVEAKLS